MTPVDVRIVSSVIAICARWSRKDVPRRPALPDQRDPPTARRLRRRDDIRASSNFLGRFTAQNGHIARDFDETRAILCAVAGQRHRLQNVMERLVVTGRTVARQDLPHEIRRPASAGPALPGVNAGARLPMTAASCDERQSFWTTVYPLYMQREIQQPAGSVRKARRSAGQLQDRRETLQHGQGRLQAVLALLAEARLPAPVQGIQITI